MRTMYDSITPANLPSGGDLYAGYVDGRWPNAPTIAKRFPGKPVVRIATSPSTNDGVVGDGPPDNGTWAEWVQWTVRRRAAGADPTMYTNASNWAAGKAAFAAAKVAEPHWWIARYSADHTIPAGAVALQHTETAGYDVSAVADYWPGVDPAPEPAPAAAGQTIEETSMQIEPLSVHPGEYAAVAPADAKTIAVVADGYSEPGASLRVVLWSSAGQASVLPTVTLGGTSGHHVVGIPLAGAVAVTVRRLDHEDYPLALGFRA